jgi:hypothetical protein
MTNFKKQQEKLLRNEIASKMMEYLMGLNQKNSLAIHRLSVKSSAKIVKAYYAAIKLQRKKAMKSSLKKGKKQAIAEGRINCMLQNNLIAS